MWSQIEATFKQMDTAETELECFKVLQKQELLAATSRVTGLVEEVNMQKALEETLQRRYGDLIAEHDRLCRLLEEHKKQIRMEEEIAARNRAIEEEIAARNHVVEEEAEIKANSTEENVTTEVHAVNEESVDKKDHLSLAIAEDVTSIEESSPSQTTHDNDIISDAMHDLEYQTPVANSIVEVSCEPSQNAADVRMNVDGVDENDTNDKITPNANIKIENTSSAMEDATNSGACDQVSVSDCRGQTTKDVNDEKACASEEDVVKDTNVDPSLNQ